MSLSAQAATFAFGPQTGFGVPATAYYRHRALAVDLSVIDETREGQPEVGGLAVPTFPYKPGPIVAGGASLQPRLEASLGWLLYAALGKHEVGPAGTPDTNSIVATANVAATGALTVLGNPVTPSHLLFTGLYVLGSVTMEIVGTDIGDAAITEVFVLNSDTPKRTTKIFKTVTSITKTVGGTSGTFTVGEFTAAPYYHKFIIDPLDSTFIPWLSARKQLPKRNGDSATDLGEIYTDMKVVGLTFSMANDAPLVMRADFLGCKFELDHNPEAWTYDNSFESWESVPVNCSVGGYIMFDDVELPVVAAQVSMQNAPLDVRQERVIGNPFLEDITILQRRMAYQITVKWNNPELYAQVLTGSTSGTQWSAAPTTGSFDINTVSSVNIPGLDVPYEIRLHADEVMLSHQGGIQLAGNGAVLLNFQGVALEQDEYCSITILNEETDYSWPT